MHVLIDGARAKVYKDNKNVQPWNYEAACSLYQVNKTCTAAEMSAVQCRSIKAARALLSALEKHCREMLGGNHWNVGCYLYSCTGAKEADRLQKAGMKKVTEWWSPGHDCRVQLLVYVPKKYTPVNGHRPKDFKKDTSAFLR